MDPSLSLLRVPADEMPQLCRVSGSPVEWKKKILFHSAVTFMKLLSRSLSLVLSYNWTKCSDISDCGGRFQTMKDAGDGRGATKDMGPHHRFHRFGPDWCL